MLACLPVCLNNCLSYSRYPLFFFKKWYDGDALTIILINVYFFLDFSKPIKGINFIDALCFLFFL